MTLALIVLIIFLFAWIFDSAKRNKKEEEEKKRTITNVALEKQIRLEWVKKIDEDLKSAKTDLNPFDFLLSLYEKYNMPVYRGFGPTNEELRKDFLKEEKHFDIDYKFHLSTAEYERKKISKEHPELKSEVPYIFCYEGKNTNAMEISYCFVGEYAPFAPKYHTEKDNLLYEADGGRYDYLSVVVPYDGTLYNRVRGNYYSRVKYIDLIELLTKKSLYERGFVPSPDGIHESAWQEREKANKAYDERKKKYPWL